MWRCASFAAFAISISTKFSSFFMIASSEFEAEDRGNQDTTLNRGSFYVKTPTFSGESLNNRFSAAGIEEGEESWPAS